MHLQMQRNVWLDNVINLLSQTRRHYVTSLFIGWQLILCSWQTLKVFFLNVKMLLVHYSGDNHNQNFPLGRYIVGYTVGNLVLRRRVSDPLNRNYDPLIHVCALWHLRFVLSNPTEEPSPDSIHFRAINGPPTIRSFSWWTTVVVVC